MSRPTMSAIVRLNTLTWTEVVVAGGGGGADLPDFRPYLWTVFFKLDGSTLSVSSAAAVVGVPTVVGTPGKHIDLGWNNAQIGQPIDIPDDIGEWITDIRPIPIDPAIQGIVGEVDFPGVFGAVAVVMIDGGHIPAHTVEAGRVALTNGVMGALTALVAKIGPDYLPTPDNISAALASAVSDVGPAVKKAMTDSLSFWEELWALTGSDQEAGDVTIYWTQDQFGSSGGSQNYTLDIPLGATGSWEIAGMVDLMLPCPADAVTAVLDGLFGGISSPSPATGSKQHRPGAPSKWITTIESMRTFRNSGEMAKIPGVAAAWRSVSDHAPQLVRLLAHDAELRTAVAAFMSTVPELLRDPSAPFAPEQARSLEQMLVAIAKKGDRRLKSRAERWLVVVRASHGGSVREALQRLGEVERSPKARSSGRKEHGKG